VFLLAGTVGGLILIGLSALLAGGNVASVARSDADLRAAHGVDLLATIGTELPQLTSLTIAGRLSPAAVIRLDLAVRHGQQEGLLANLVIWDRSGRIVYSSVDSSAGTRPPKAAPDLRRALAGHTATRTHPDEVDPSSGKRTGVLDAYEPLTDHHGTIFGALEASLPLKAIDSTAAHAQQRTVLFAIGTGALLWLLLMPLWVRLARSQANDWIPGRLRTLRRFRKALDRGEIELAYQPQIEPGSRHVAAVEALVRWRRDGELIPPDRFLPAVESSALMSRLTDRVLELALGQLTRWRHAGIVIRVSVNISATDLADISLPERIAGMLELHAVTGQCLTVEVTETAILEDAEQAAVVLAGLDALGIDIAVDDFGTGHASISRLHRLPVSEVKIDRSFVSDTKHRSRTYLAAMVGFGRGLGLRVVAEGVEDAETLAFLGTLDCDLAQGYFISRPLEAAAMTSWLTTAPRGDTSSISPTDRPLAHGAPPVISRT
jgi:EAL domain-containing protein (putative c-di-GMP-specific phosphodiesterase class I)